MSHIQNCNVSRSRGVDGLSCNLIISRLSDAVKEATYNTHNGSSRGYRGNESSDIRIENGRPDCGGLICKHWTTCVFIDCKTAKYLNGILLYDGCRDSHLSLFEGQKSVMTSAFKSRLGSMHRLGNISCDKHPDKLMDTFCTGCSKVICSTSSATEHELHNVILHCGAVEAEKADAVELCVEASIFE